MSVELLASEKYIKLALIATGLLPPGAGIYAGVLPQGASLPAVLMSRQSAPDTNGGGGSRLLTQPVYFIRGVVDPTCLGALGAMAKAIDTAFHLDADTPPAAIGNVLVRGAHRIEPMLGDTTENGVTYTYAGGLYRIFCYETVSAPVAVVPASPLPPAAPVVYGQPFAPTNSKLFMLHWQASCIAYGNVPWQIVGSVEGYVVAITEAKRAGADGFGIDTGGNDANYKASLTNLYAAANQVNAAAGWGPGQTGTYNAQGVGKFSLYLKFDFSNVALETTAAIVDLLQPLLHDPANWVWQGRPVYSTYVGGGGRSWASLAAIFQPANAQLTVGGVRPYLIWGGEITNADGSGAGGSDASIAAWLTGCVKPFADAVWQFPNPSAALGPKSGIPAAEQLARLCKAAGLAYQASLLPAYGQTANPSTRFLENHNGLEGASAAMQSIIRVQQPELGIECVGANDLGELTNVLAGSPWIAGGVTPSPAAPVWVGYPKSDIPNYYQSKLGLQALLLFFVQEMKTSQVPQIANDTLCGAYYVQTGAAMQGATNDPLGPLFAENTDLGSGSPAGTPDTFYAACLFAKSRLVRLTQDNGYSVTKLAPPGVSLLRLPCLAGSVKVEALDEHNQVILTMTGPSIAGAAAVVNANVATMTVHN